MRIALRGIHMACCCRPIISHFCLSVFFSPNAQTTVISTEEVHFLFCLTWHNFKTMWKKNVNKKPYDLHQFTHRVDDFEFWVFYLSADWFVGDFYLFYLSLTHTLIRFLWCISNSFICYDSECNGLITKLFRAEILPVWVVRISSFESKQIEGNQGHSHYIIVRIHNL